MLSGLGEQLRCCPVLMAGFFLHFWARWHAHRHSLWVVFDSYKKDYGCCLLALSSSPFRHSSRLVLRSFAEVVTRSLHSFNPSPSIWTGFLSVRARWHAHRHSFNFISVSTKNGTGSQLSHHSFAGSLFSTVYHLVSLSTLACSHPGFVLVQLAVLWL